MRDEPTTSENLPNNEYAQLEQEIDLTKLHPQEHPELYQEGPYVKCRCHGHGYYVGHNRLLDRVKGELVLKTIRGVY